MAQTTTTTAGKPLIFGRVGGKAGTALTCASTQQTDVLAAMTRLLTGRPATTAVTSVRIVRRHRMLILYSRALASRQAQAALAVLSLLRASLVVCAAKRVWSAAVGTGAGSSRRHSN